MTSTKSTYLALLAILLSPMAANADVIDFETGSIDGAGLYTEGDFNLMVNDFNGSNAALQSAQNPGNATRIFAFCAVDGPCGVGTSLSLTDGGAFSISNIDAANWQFENGGIGMIDLIGYFVGGGSLTVTIDTADVWASYSLVGLNNLSSLDIIGRSVYAFAIDNIDLNAVPEPGTLALLGIGLAGLGFARRKKV